MNPIYWFYRFKYMIDDIGWPALGNKLSRTRLRAYNDHHRLGGKK